MQINLRQHWHYAAGGTFFLIFLVLMTFRLDIFRENTAANRSVEPVAVALPERDAWMTISQEGRKIGYAHRRFFSVASGYRSTEEVFLRINTMGVSQALRYQTEGELSASLALASFKFSLDSGLFSFTAQGTVTDRLITVYAGPPGEEKRAEVPLKEPIHLTASLLELPRFKGLQPGESQTFSVFDPAAMGESPVTVSALDEETVIHQGKSRRVRKLSLDFMGAEQFAWLDEEGNVLREKGILGITLEKATKKEALEGIGGADSADLTELASIGANKTIPDPGAINELKVKIGNTGKGVFFLDGDRQTFHNGIVTIRKETIPASPNRGEIDRDSPFLKPATMIQSDHPLIFAKVKEIVSENDSDAEKAGKIVNWIYKNVRKRPVLSVPNALDTLRNRVGDCNEHAVLLAAMARAAGIPADVESGLVYLGGRFYYHAWNALYIGGWVTADAVLGQMPADVTHIRFLRGTAERQIDLLGLIGRIRPEILTFF